MSKEPLKKKFAMAKMVPLAIVGLTAAVLLVAWVTQLKVDEHARETFPPYAAVATTRYDGGALSATPAGDTAHCGTVSGAVQHPRCPFRAGAPVCDRLVIDDFVTPAELAALRRLVDGAMAYSPGGAGGVTLVDLTGGILSYRTQFLDLFKTMQKTHAAKKAPAAPLAAADADVYTAVLQRVRAAVVERFLPAAAAANAALHVSSPAFFSRITDAPALTPNDEYWHVHVDTAQYGNFDVTTLLYLTTQQQPEDGAGVAMDGNFTGGSFEFVDGGDDGSVTAAVAVPPVAARLLMFTSGAEHPHRVSPVTGGVRYAITTAFTCQKTKKPPVDVGSPDFLAAFRKQLAQRPAQAGA
jgi:hypothetical protein